ncbi:GIY-YIG nuclease family protein [Streptomyces sp. NPDC054847]
MAEPMSLEERQNWRDAQRTAVYRLYDEDGVLLYVGITYDVPERWRHHRRHKPWWPQVAHERLVWYDTRPEAEAAETHAIVAEEPLHNQVKNWSDFRANYRIQWIGGRLREERSVLCTPRRPRAKAKLARVVELEGQLRLLADHAPNQWGAWHWQKNRSARQVMEDILCGRGPVLDDPLTASRCENDECPLCGGPVPCPVVKEMAEPYREHPFYCL